MFSNLVGLYFSTHGIDAVDLDMSLHHVTEQALTSFSRIIEMSVLCSMDPLSDMQAQDQVGHLSLYMGPMFSGKTSRLLALHKQYSFCGVPLLVINFAEDDRYTDDERMSSHDKVMVPCRTASLLKEINDFDKEPTADFQASKVILINEGQFFVDIVEWVNKAIASPFHKKVHICGLDGDFRAQRFGDWLDLIPQADHVEKLAAICSGCKMCPGIFSHRTTAQEEQKVIGVECYVPLCRKCYASARGQP